METNKLSLCRSTPLLEKQITRKTSSKRLINTSSRESKLLMERTRMLVGESARLLLSTTCSQELLGQETLTIVTGAWTALHSNSLRKSSLTSTNLCPKKNITGKSSVISTSLVRIEE